MKTIVQFSISRDSITFCAQMYVFIGFQEKNKDHYFLNRLRWLFLPPLILLFMMHYFDIVIEWYKLHLNYGTITLLMAVESSFIPLPSELIIPPAAILAFQGHLSLPWVIVCSTLGCVLGALFNYILSFYLGRKIIYALAETKWARIFFVTPAKVEEAEHYFLKNGNTSTLIGRLIPGIRHLISIPAGLSKMNLRSFILYTALGSAIWNTILAVMSYYLAANWKVYFREITWGFVLLGVGFAIYLIYKAVKKNEPKQDVGA